MGLFGRSGLALLFALAATAVLASPATAREMWIESFHTEIAVAETGRVTVEERIAVNFQGSWNGIFRFIPYRYQVRGIRGSIRLSVDAVEDDQGRELEHWKHKTGGNVSLKIRVPGAQNAIRTVVIRYHADNVIRLYDQSDEEFGTYDELYWNVTGTGWQVPIKRVSATVTLPEGVPGKTVRTTAFLGRYRATEGRLRASIEEGPPIRFEAEELVAHEGLTIVVGFEPGHVRHPTTLTKAQWFATDNFFLLFPSLALLAWWLLWRKFGRDDLSKHTIVPEFEPPTGLRPAHVGILADDKLDQRDMTASIVDLAVRGLITIEYDEDADTRLTLHREKLGAAQLDGFEEELVAALFGDSGTERRLEDLEYKFYKRIDDIRTLAVDDLVAKKLFLKAPRNVTAKWSGLTILVVAVLGILGFFMAWPLPYWLLLGLAAVLMFVIAKHMPQRTGRGLDALARVRGLEEYLVTAEEQRMRSLPMETLERLIPYALALGVGDRWMEAFTSIYSEQPEWIHTTGAWYPGTLGRTMDSMQSDVGKNLYSGPRAQTSGGSSFGGSWSGGSGFSGGGFSGGGFGGGGGGGW